MELVTILWIVYFAPLIGIWQVIKTETFWQFIVAFVFIVSLVSSYGIIQIKETKERFAEQGMYLQEDKK